MCGIDIDKDKIFISFGALRRGDVDFIGEAVIPFDSGSGDFLNSIEANIDKMQNVIANKFQSSKVVLRRSFLKLPAGLEKMEVAEEVVALKRTKKIAPCDLLFAKKYLEDNALDWDDCCIHHFPLNFGIEGKAFDSLPVGFWTKRVRVKSLLVTVKDKLRSQAYDIFNNYDIPFSGFISNGICDFSAVFGSSPDVNAVVNVGYDNTLLTVVDKGVLSAVESFNFGTKGIIDAISEHFSICFNLAQDIFDLHVSFLILIDGIQSKEVVLKNGDDYVHVSMDKVNFLACEYLREKINLLLSRVKNDSGVVKLAFLGRLNSKDGFADFLRSFVPFDVIVFDHPANSSSSFGCARYGVSRFLEKTQQSRVPLSQKLVNIYKEYF